jgi:hypothetical protein
LYPELESLRKYIAILFISFAFAALQGGKIAAYLICKWQMEVIQKQANCDCEKHLSGIDEQTTSSPSAGVLKEKPAELFENTFYSIYHSKPNTSSRFFSENASPLSEGFALSCFRPPSGL